MAIALLFFSPLPLPPPTRGGGEKTHVRVPASRLYPTPSHQIVTGVDLPGGALEPNYQPLTASTPSQAQYMTTGKPS